MTQSWMSLIAFIIAIILIMVFNSRIGSDAAGCFSSVAEDPDAAPSSDTTPRGSEAR